MISETKRLLLALAGSAVVALILAACDDGGTVPERSPTAAPTASPTPTSTTLPSPAPTAAPSPAPSPTPEPVLSPCEAVPALPATVSDQANLYSISIPADWAVVTDEGATGVQLSRIVLESPDFSVFVDEAAEGPFTPIYYETGATLVIHVTNVASGPPSHSDS